jgi:aspartyl-tRNA synthetase
VDCENAPVIRTHEAGTLRATDAGSTVTLAGWVARRRDHGGVTFIDLRDASGIVQIVLRGATATEDGLSSRDEDQAHALRNEYCVKVTGEVGRRPPGNENPELPTGEVEVVISRLEVLSEAAPLPLPVDDHVDAGDDIRLRYRYLDLRRTGPAKALRCARGRTRSPARCCTRTTSTRSRRRRSRARRQRAPATSSCRFASSPARGMPCRSHLSSSSSCSWWPEWSATTRSPAATGTRTSGPTASPSFTQLDIEMSFVTQDDVIELAEEIVGPALVGARVLRDPAADPAPDLARRDVALRLDKPDLRYGVELTDLTGYLRGPSSGCSRAPSRPAATSARS